MGRAPSPFWDRVQRGEGCWEWTAATDRHGAGVVWWEGKTRRAAAVALALSSGRWPRATVKTSCGNPACCRPDHLVEATAASPPKKSAVNRAPRREVVLPRPSYGRGSVRMLDRGVWELRLPVRTTVWPSPPAVSRTFRGSRAEAEDALAELCEQAEHGGPLRVDPTFGEMVSAYLDWYQRESDVGVPGADLVVAAARGLAEEASVLADVRVAALAGGRAINEWELAMVDAERPLTEVRGLHQALVGLLGWGVAHGWIRRARDPRPLLASFGAK